jgi:hypothetical protein
MTDDVVVVEKKVELNKTPLTIPFNLEALGEVQRILIITKFVYIVIGLNISHNTSMKIGEVR